MTSETINAASTWVVYVEKDAATNFEVARVNSVWGASEISKFFQSKQAGKAAESQLRKGDTVVFVHDLVQKSQKNSSFPRLQLDIFIDSIEFAKEIVLTRVESELYEEVKEIWSDGEYPARFRFSELRQRRK